MAQPPISDAEMAVLKLLWQQGEGTVRQLHAQLRRRRKRWAYNTVLTLLSRLREKGYVASQKGDSGAALVFRAAISRGQLLKRSLSELADSVCDGAASPLVHALVEGKQFSAEELAELRKLLDGLQSDADPS